MKRIIFVVVLLIFSSFSMTASAAGPAYNWTGFYAGLQGSYVIGSSDWDFLDYGTHTDHTIDGGMGGLLLGFNYQTPVNIVVGIETDISGGKISGSSFCPNDDFECNSEINWVGSTRVRVGYAINRFFPYIGIGVAYTDVNLHANFTGTDTEFANSKNSYIGWTPSVGVEYVIVKDLIARMEYAYYDFGKEQVVFSDGETVDNRIKFHGFKFALSWKF